MSASPTPSEDWRLRVTLHEDGLAHALRERLAVSDLKSDLEHAFADRVVVSTDGPELFLYTGDSQQAERAEAVIDQLASTHGWEVTKELRRWHQDALEWEDPAEPLPSTDEERAAEHAEAVQDERADAVVRGYPDYEVQVESDSREHAGQLADLLAAEGLPTVRRFRYVLLGALDEDSAAALAERVRTLVPDGTPVTVQGTLRSVADDVGPSPFAIVGAFAG